MGENNNIKVMEKIAKEMRDLFYSGDAEYLSNDLDFYNEVLEP